jgi:ubiquitin-protein ligase E3 C
LLLNLVFKSFLQKILVEPQFAGTFLNVLLGRINQFDDLWSFDKEIYKSLTNLKTLRASIKDVDLIAQLDMYFVMDVTRMDMTETVDLIPNGSNTLVTKDNLVQFIHRFAHAKLNVEVASQCRAFLAGFRSIIPATWMRMFSRRELQLLISGDDQRAIDIADFKRNVHYAGGYHETQPYIQVCLIHRVPSYFGMS